MYTQRFIRVLPTVALGLLALLVVTAVPARAQNAQTRYERAQARERDARNAARPNLTTLRSVAVAYEQIVRRFPRSGYSDNALWQGAGVLQLAWEHAGQTRDRDQALKLLRWLRSEYPSSSLIRQIGVRTTELTRSRDAVAENTAPGSSPSRAHPVDATVPASTAPTPVADAVSRPKRSEPIVVRGLSHTPLPRGERLTLELSDEPSFTESASSPGAILLLVDDARIASAIVDAAARIRGSVIRSVRIEQADGQLRLHVGVNGTPRHSSFTLYGPDRLVFDFEALAEQTTSDTSRSAVPQPYPRASDSVARVTRAADREPSAHVPAASTAASSPSAPPAITVAATTPGAADAPPSEPTDSSPAPPASIGGGYSLARQLGLGVSRIVIDPGHGGSDPGAQANGITEAALVLDVALRLEKLLLAQPGFEVVLTRRTNTAIPLDRRTAVANEESADLFLSIHANSSPRRATAGVETYFLNLATSQQAEAVAARENASSAEAMHTLPQLVRAITTNNKLAESRELADAVQSSLVRRLAPRNSGFQDLGVKQAPFVVLIGAQMPSVLAEIAFLTNRTEAGLLKQSAYKQQIAQALCDAILRYSASLKKVATVTASAEGR